MCLISFFFFKYREFSLLGLFIIGVGTGGIKPCVSAFGGEQFVRPQQDKQLEQFFSYFYISINAGSLLSTLLTPILREDVQCFGQNSCFPLAFGVPAVLMVVAIGIVSHPSLKCPSSFLNCSFFKNCNFSFYFELM
jgi:solute carrier family 15 oligopeptide transporter 1